MDYNKGMKEHEGKVVQFLKYNNTVPIILGILFLSTSATLAASPEVRDAVYSAQSQVRSVDNSYITSVNLDTFPFAVKVTGVTEDDYYYYIAYDLRTIDIADYVWQAVTKTDTMKIHKDSLRGGELKDYADVEFAQIRNRELQRLIQTQEYERALGTSQKTVATAYTGVIGKFVEPNEETLPFYQPPPELQDTDSSLALKNPVPLVTWDENAQPEPVGIVVEEPSDEPSNNENPTEPEPTEPDACPDIEGTQASVEECPGQPEEPVTEEPPVEQPPVEEPVVETPPEETPQPEPEPGPEEPTQ